MKIQNHGGAVSMKFVGVENNTLHAVKEISLIVLFNISMFQRMTSF